LRSIFRKSGEFVLAQTHHHGNDEESKNGIIELQNVIVTPLSFLRRLTGWDKIDAAIWGGCSVKWKMYMLYDQVIPLVV